MSSAPVDLVVAIVNHSNRDDTLRCLESLAGDEGRRASVRVVVLDNDSDDGSVAAIRAAHPEVEVIAQDVRRGFGANQNAIIQATAQPLRAGSQQRHARLARRPRHARALPRRASPRGRGRPAGDRARRGAAALGVVVSHGLERGRARARRQAPGGLRARRRRLPLRLRADAPPQRAGEIGGFDEDYFMYAEEKDLCRRIQDAGYAVHLVPSASIVHLEARSSSGAPRIARDTEFWRSQRLYLRKHHSSAGALAIEAQTAAQRLALALAVLRSRVSSRPACAGASSSPGSRATSRARPSSRSPHRAVRACASSPTSTTRSSVGRRREAPAADRRDRRSRSPQPPQAGRATTARRRGSGLRARTSSSRPRRPRGHGRLRSSHRAAAARPSSWSSTAAGRSRPSHAPCKAPRRREAHGPSASPRAHGARDAALDRRRARIAGRCPRSARAALGQAGQRLSRQVFWVSVAVPRSQRAGVYRGICGSAASRPRYSVRVADVTLPQRRALHTWFLVWSDARR